MNIEERTYNVITKEKTLEELYVLKDFPVYMGCVPETINSNTDIKADMIFDICTHTGIIQLRKVLPLDITNQFPHNDSVGILWDRHNKEFINFLSEFTHENILEIGGGSGKLANLYTNINNCKWTIIDKQYSGDKNDNIYVINEWFDKNFSLTQYNTVVHSHLLEHITDPIDFLTSLSSNLQQGSLHIFSVPNLYEWLKCKYTNCLNFEHTLFITEKIIDELLYSSGFSIIKKYYFTNHSIFYACKKTHANPLLHIKNYYTEYKKLFNGYIKTTSDTVIDLNEKINLFNGTVYLFGAHIFSQMLLSFGLDESKISCLLDNSDLKYKKRLYGTNLVVEKPAILKDKKNVMVIVRAGTYTEEIKNDILNNINSEVIFI